MAQQVDWCPRSQNRDLGHPAETAVTWQQKFLRVLQEKSLFIWKEVECSLLSRHLEGSYGYSYSSHDS
jgi:hypothetical protein